jgi:alkylation response protein AidB-like acyl-CoA dehydrogenase
LVTTLTVARREKWKRIVTYALTRSDLAMKACDSAAFSRHLALERLFRDARAGWVMAPTVDVLAEFTGRILTGLPLF